MDDITLLREAIGLSHAARASGNHPFGALICGPDGEVLIRSGNSFSLDGGVGHAEMNVARQASARFEPAFLARCTLVTTVEPCCMCAGGAYWAGVGTVVYGLDERRLAELTGDDPENLTMALDCRVVFAAGRRPISVRGPFPELEEEIIAAHAGFWTP